MRSSSFLLLAVAVLACSASVALARPTASTCGFGGLDFSSLVGLDIVGSDGSSTYTYLLSLCGSLTSSAASSCLQVSPQASACQKETQQAQAFDVGNWNAASAPTWSYIEPARPDQGVQYTMVGAQSCWASGQPQTYETTVQLVCASSQLPLTVSTTQGSCAMTFTLPTPLACSSAPPAPQKCGAVLGGTTYDLSPLMGTDLVGSDGTQNYKYYTSVCGDLSSAATASCTSVVASAAACQMQVQGGTGTYVTGEWPGSNADVQWSYMDAANPALGVQYTLQGTQSCWATGIVSDYVVTVQFQCASEQSQEFAVAIPQGSCNQTYTIQTPLACAGAPPAPTVACGTTLDGVTFDFSSLTGADITGSDGTSPAVYEYFLNVCGVLSSPSAAPCTQIMSDSSACQLQVAGGTGAFDTGDWVTSSPPQWSWVDPNNQLAGVQVSHIPYAYTMTGAESCWAHPPVQEYTVNVQFVCGTATSPETFKVTIPQGSCIQNYTIPTPLACNKVADLIEDGRTALF